VTRGGKRAILLGAEVLQLPQKIHNDESSMASEYPVLLPKLGESIVSATVVHWLKKEGDLVREDEPLVEVATDKVNSEIPAPCAGRLTELCVPEGREVQVGEMLAKIEQANVVGEEMAIPPRIAPSHLERPGETAGSLQATTYLSPAVLSLAAERGIGTEELRRISGSGEGGRLTKKDLEAYLSQRTSVQSLPRSCAGATGVRRPAASSPPGGEGIEVRKMSPLRKMIADNMVRSFFTAPHASIFAEADVTALQQQIQQKKGSFEAAHSAKLSITTTVVYALSRIARKYPLLNSEVHEDRVYIKHYVNLGIAVSVEEGVMVPVIRNCDNASLPEIAQALASLAHKARHSQLQPSDAAGGTITLTNYGMSGIQMGLPILRYPEVSILGVGALQKKPVVIEDRIEVRLMLPLSLTFDHRVFDGMYACEALAQLVSLVQSLEIA